MRARVMLRKILLRKSAQSDRGSSRGHWLPFVGALFAAVVFLTACGSDADSDGDPSESTLAAPAVADLEASDEGVPQPLNGDPGGFEFCRRLMDLPSIDSLPFTSGPARLREALEPAVATVFDLELLSPPELQADTSTVVNQLVLVGGIADEVGYDFVIANQELLDEAPFIDLEARSARSRLEAFCERAGTPAGPASTTSPPLTTAPDADPVAQRYESMGLSPDEAACMSQNFGDFDSNEELQLLLFDGVGDEADALLSVCDVSADQLR